MHQYCLLIEQFQPLRSRLRFDRSAIDQELYWVWRGGYMSLGSRALKTRRSRNLAQTQLSLLFSVSSEKCYHLESKTTYVHTVIGPEHSQILAEDGLD